jgi:hypothetical protein
VDLRPFVRCAREHDCVQLSAGVHTDDAPAAPPAPPPSLQPGPHVTTAASTEPTKPPAAVSPSAEEAPDVVSLLQTIASLRSALDTAEHALERERALRQHAEAAARAAAARAEEAEAHARAERARSRRVSREMLAAAPAAEAVGASAKEIEASLLREVGLLSDLDSKRRLQPRTRSISLARQPSWSEL